MGRTILRTEHVTEHPWPEDCFLQGGSRGLVISSKGNYATAFVEAFPTEPATFIRGQGETVQAADDDAWAKYQSYLQCPGHEFEPRGYTNGAGFCVHCKMFGSEVFTAEQLGLFCAVCGTPTNYQVTAGQAHCADHTMTREQRVAAGHKPSALEKLFDAFADEELGRA